MEMMKDIKYISVVLVFFFCGCTTSSKMKTVEEVSDVTIEGTIERVTVKISDQLKKKGKYSHGQKYFFYSFGYDGSRDPCQIFYNDDGYDEISKNIDVIDYDVTAMVVDEKDNYVTRATIGYIHHPPDEYVYYLRELKMIELTKQNNYLIFIQMFNCTEKFMIGYKKDKIDVYRYTDDDLIFLYSK